MRYRVSKGPVFSRFKKCLSHHYRIWQRRANRPGADLNKPIGLPPKMSEQRRLRRNRNWNKKHGFPVSEKEARA